MESIGPLSGWEAFAAPGKPWCVVGDVSKDTGLGINVYLSKKEKIKGVEVYDRATGESITAAGKVAIGKEIA